MALQQEWFEENGAGKLKKKIKNCRCSEKGEGDFLFLTAMFLPPLFIFAITPHNNSFGQ